MPFICSVDLVGK